MKPNSTLRSYLTSVFGPWIVAMNRSVDNAVGYIQTQVVAVKADSDSANASAAAASASQSSAATSSTAAGNSANAATIAASQAQSAYAAVQAILASFNAIWLGDYPSDPTVDNNGNPLQNGALYFNNSNPQTNTTKDADGNLEAGHFRTYQNGAWHNLDAASEAELNNAIAAANSAAGSASAANTSANNAANSAAAAAASAQQAQNASGQAQAAVPTPSSSSALDYIRVNSAGSQYEFRTPTQTLSDLAAAPLASPALTGTPTAPTAPPNTSTTQLATTSFVLGQAGSAAPIMSSGSTGTVGTSYLYARQDHIHPTDTTRAAAAGNAAQTFTASKFLAGWGTPGSNIVAGYSFTSDGYQDTGMFSDTDGWIYFYNNSIKAVILDDNGNFTLTQGTANFNSNVTVTNGALNLNTSSSAVQFTSANNVLSLAAGTTANNGSQFTYTFDNQGNVGLGNANISNSVNVGNVLNLRSYNSRIYSQYQSSGANSTNYTIVFNVGSTNTYANTNGSWNFPGNITASSGTISAAVLALPNDSLSPIGNIKLTASQPFVQFAYGESATWTTMIQAISNNELKILDSNGTNGAILGTSYHSFYYGYNTSGGTVTDYRLTFQNDGNAVFYKESTTNGTTTSTSFVSFKDTGSTINSSLAANGGLAVQGGTKSDTLIVTGNATLDQTLSVGMLATLQGTTAHPFMRRTILGAGTSSFTQAPGATFARVIIVGGGGSGGNAQASSNTYSVASGGCGAGTAMFDFTYTPGSTYSGQIQVGGGASPSGGGSTNGNTGGNTVAFGITASGGPPGVGSAWNTTPGNGWLVGANSGGGVNVGSASGGTVGNLMIFNGAGGGVSLTIPAIPGQTSVNVSGTGGSSQMGQGGGPAGFSSSSSTGVNGGNGLGYGSGGGGAAAFNNGSWSGGRGADGIAVIDEYF